MTHSVRVPGSEQLNQNGAADQGQMECQNSYIGNRMSYCC